MKLIGCLNKLVFLLSCFVLIDFNIYLITTTHQQISKPPSFKSESFATPSASFTNPAVPTTTSTSSRPTGKLVTEAPKRPCVLKSFLQRPTTLSDGDSSSFNEAVYSLIDLLAETSNYLKKFNTTETLVVVSASKTRASTSRLSKKLVESCDMMEKSSRSAPILKSIVNTLDRIEFISTRLNDELNKLLEACLKIISNGGTTTTTTTATTIQTGTDETLDATLVQNNAALSVMNGVYVENTSSLHSSSIVLKAFIDLLCLAFDTSFNLFLLRIGYFYHQLSSSSSPSSVGQRINKLKDDFFNVVYHVLDSIDFCSSTRGGGDKSGGVKIMMGDNSKK